MGFFRKAGENDNTNQHAAPLPAAEPPAPAPVSSTSPPTVAAEPTDWAADLAATRARSYAAACTTALAAANECLEVANRAVGAHKMAAQRPQHEISIQHFANLAAQEDQNFVPLYRAFSAASSAAKAAAAELLACDTERDPEMILMMCVSEDDYTNTGTVRHLLLADFGPTPTTYLEGLERANAAIQADIFGLGEEGFQGHIYSPPPSSQSTEATCPWCAETIKVKAVVCRFCGRDVATPPVSGTVEGSPSTRWNEFGAIARRFGGQALSDSLWSFDLDVGENETHKVFTSLEVIKPSLQMITIKSFICLLSDVDLNWLMTTWGQLNAGSFAYAPLEEDGMIMLASAVPLDCLQLNDPTTFMLYLNIFARTAKQLTKAAP